eukprot:3935925-Rhodomonas_salina.2
MAQSLNIAISRFLPAGLSASRLSHASWLRADRGAAQHSPAGSELTHSSHQVSGASPCPVTVLLRSGSVLDRETNHPLCSRPRS